MNSLRGIWVLSCYGVSTALTSLLSLLVSIWSEEEARALAQLWARANLWVAGIKVKVEGKENLPIGQKRGGRACDYAFLVRLSTKRREKGEKGSFVRCQWPVVRCSKNTGHREKE